MTPDELRGAGDIRLAELAERLDTINKYLASIDLRLADLKLMLVVQK